MVFFFLFFFFLGATVWVMTDLSVSTYIHIHDLARPDASLFFFFHFCTCSRRVIIRATFGGFISS